MPALNAEAFKQSADSLKKGNKHVGLACLSWLTNDLSYLGLKLQASRIAELGKTLWCAQASDVVVDAATAATQSGVEVPADAAPVPYALVDPSLKGFRI